MKPYITIAALCLLMPAAQAGGPSLQSNDLTVGDIVTSADAIIMQVSGTIDLFTRKAPDESHQDGNAKIVTLLVEDAILRIPRKRWKHPGGDEFEVYTDWERYKSEITKWRGKEIFTQMWSTELILRDGAVREIVADQCKIWDRKS